MVFPISNQKFKVPSATFPALLVAVFEITFTPGSIAFAIFDLLIFSQTNVETFAIFALFHAIIPHVLPIAQPATIKAT
jgi:hypothetical protein